MPTRTLTRKTSRSGSSKTNPSRQTKGKSPAKRRDKLSSKTPPAKTPKVFLVNMIPRSLSGEAHQDSEPTIAVNPANPMQIAGSAFTPDPAKGPLAPIYVSLDGGVTWTLNSIVPGANRNTGTGDITVQFSKTNNTLYAGILRGDSRNMRMNILRAKDFTAAQPMEILVDRKNVDQPYLQVHTVTSGAGKGSDRVYVGNNDLSTGSSATIDQSLDGAAKKPNFKTIRIESRATPGQDGPPVRPSIHPDGTAYAIYHSWRTFNNRTGAGTADIVVVRDDKGGGGAKSFMDLVDPDDGQAGIRVVQNTKFNFNGFLGAQRTGGDVALAADPTNSDIVYIAYNDDQGQDYLLHLMRSKDRGRTWSKELRTLRNALNPALAINNAGRLGFLYQQLTGSGAGQRWETRLELSSDGSNWSTLTLATVSSRTPTSTFDPYLGDYAHLMAVDKNFYGVFSTANTPNKSNFPNGVVYQRNVNWTTGTLLDIDNRTPVHSSIDPFFFRVEG